MMVVLSCTFDTVYSESIFFFFFFTNSLLLLRYVASNRNFELLNGDDQTENHCLHFCNAGIHNPSISITSVVLNWFYFWTQSYIVHEMVTIYNTGHNLSLLFPWCFFSSKFSSLRMNVKQIVHFGISFSR